MAGKAGGRLTFSGRQEYMAVPVFGVVNSLLTPGAFLSGIVGYAARCSCELGDHYLARAANGSLSEWTSERGAMPDVCTFKTEADAEAAIEQWHQQHDAAQRASGETEPQEG